MGAVLEEWGRRLNAVLQTMSIVSSSVPTPSRLQPSGFIIAAKTAGEGLRRQGGSHSYVFAEGMSTSSPNFVRVKALLPFPAQGKAMLSKTSLGLLLSF